MPKPKPDDESPELELVETPSDDLVEIVFNGQAFVIPRNRDDWSTEGLAYLAESKYNLFVKYTLEIAKPGQWNMLCAACPTRKDFTAFFTAFGEAVKECVG